MQKLHFDVTGMSCAACSARVGKAVKALDGCCNVTVNLLKNDMTLELDDAKLSQDDVVKAVTAAGYGASLRDNDSNPSGKTKTQKKNSQAEVLQQELTATRKRLYWSLFFCALLMVITMLPMVGITFSFLRERKSAGLCLHTALADAAGAGAQQELFHARLQGACGACTQYGFIGRAGCDCLNALGHRVALRDVVCGGRR